jgi:hypothetical protein
VSDSVGIIQSRGIGDIIIALPIARYYHDQGYLVHWPICEQFLSHFVNTVPWVNWIEVSTDKQGKFFYDEPIRLLKQVGCDTAIPLYQSLTGHSEFDSQPWYQITGFDQYKYHAASVPFRQKWTLTNCIERDQIRERELYDRVVKNPNYMVYHVQGSDYRAAVDLSQIPHDWQQIEITTQTDCVFDWLTVLEQAQAAICVDSVFANILDQMNLTETVDCYWIPRSHIHLSPVLGGSWTILEPPAGSLAAERIFRSKG